MGIELMRSATLILLGLFLTAGCLGCGGSGIPEPAADAKAGPPPGTSDVWNKKVEKKR